MRVLPGRSSFGHHLAQVLAGDEAKRVGVSRGRIVDDVFRQRRRRILAVPAPGAPLGIEVVPERLLVVARLRATGLVITREPEARAVRRQHFVYERDLPGRIAAELELGIGDDDAAWLDDVTSERIHAETQPFE